MNSIFFFLVFAISALYADFNEQNEGRSAKGVYVAARLSYWAEQQEEMEQKKRKKYRLGNTAGKEKSANKRQLMPMTTSALEDKIRLSVEPSVYKPERSKDDLQLLPDNDVQLVSQVRHPDFLSQYQTKLDDILAQYQREEL